MKIVSWNIRGCNHPRNIKTLSRKIKQEKTDVLFLQETKCSYETLMRMGQKIWVLDKYQEKFKEILSHIPLEDMETGDGWFTWNNRRGGEHHIASQTDRLLVSENIVMGSGEIRVNVLPAASFDHWPLSLN